MNFSRNRAITFLLGVAFVAGCGGGPTTSSESGALSGPVTLDGSSTVFPISEAVAEEFGKANRGVNVTVGSSGTGGGFQKFCRGETDINDASRPVRPAEMKACQASGINFIELPVAYDGIAIVVNPKATWINDITTDELKTLWAPEAQGKVMRWSQVRAGWPDREIHLFGAGVDSGTYDYFTEAIGGKEGASRGDFTSSEDDNVLVQGISGDELAFGFLPFAYYIENQQRLKLVPVDNKKPDDGAGAIAPSLETIANGTYQPLARPVFIYVAEKSLAKPQVAAFVDFYLSQGGALAQEVGYVQLPQPVSQLVSGRYKARKMGSMFTEGSQVGVTLEHMLSKDGAK